MFDPDIPDKQRVLILQGGGALGAYDTGAFKALYEELPKIDERNGEDNRPLFDIIAGTSSGAINAAILVKHVKDNGSWQGASDKLMDFWKYISSSNAAEDVDFRIHWWNEEHKNAPNAASYEAARRYYSAKYFLQNGTPRVFSTPTLIHDDKFFDNSVSIPNNLWIRYNKDELRKSIYHFAKLPIATVFGEPRLLIVSTDIEDGATVTFDSYSKQSEYGRYNKDCLWP
jgi:NTE family protein